MKKLSIEEKARRYDEAIEVARKIKNNEPINVPDGTLIPVAIFPELKESREDEMIRIIKEVILNSVPYKINILTKDTTITAEEAIAWLEKQGKQKPNYCHHEVDLSECSEEYRKAYYDGWNNCNMQHSQCKSELDDVVKCLINGMKFYYEDNKEATWGTDKWSMPVKHIIEVLEKQGEQKPAWSEEDEARFESCIKVLQTSDGYDTINANWLKSLKYRLQPQPKQEWSREDKYNHNIILYLLNNECVGVADKRIAIEWFKSLKDKYTWKPSDEQMKALWDSIPEKVKEISEREMLLDSLYQDLKKLREA